MLTWEYPPRVVGGISRHCYELSRALVRKGVEVVVVTLEFPEARSYEKVDGVEVYRVKVEIGNPNFLVWILIFNHFMEKLSGDLHWSKKFDLIHVHDWLTTIAGISLKHSIRLNMVLTIHSTEIGRSGGLFDPDSFTKDSIEWWGTYEAAQVIAVSSALRREIIEHFKVPEDKITAIPNGVDTSRLEIEVDINEVERKYGISSNDKIVLSVGRLTSQKGFQYLIRAFPLILSKHPSARLVIVGDGWMRGELERIAIETGVRNRVVFTGFIPDKDLVALLKRADVIVVPSVYEPFGITALEGMSLGKPIVASRIGGLAEIIQHEVNGVHVFPGDPSSIAWGVNRVLEDPDFARRIGENARKIVKTKYEWNIIAEKTIEVYRKALGW